jgi:hypothetical protein
MLVRNGVEGGEGTYEDLAGEHPDDGAP